MVLNLKAKRDIALGGIVPPLGQVHCVRCDQGKFVVNLLLPACLENPVLTNKANHLRLENVVELDVVTCLHEKWLSHQTISSLVEVVHGLEVVVKPVILLPVKPSSNLFFVVALEEQKDIFVAP